MADLTITPSSVAPSSGAFIISSHAAQVEITAGQFVFLENPNPSEKWQLIVKNLVNAAADSSKRGIALNHAYAGQRLHVCIYDPNFNLGATLVQGITYAIGSVSGAVAPLTDLTAPAFPIVLGQAISTSRIYLQSLSSGSSL